MGSQTGAQVGGLGLMMGGKLIGSFLGGPVGGAIGGLIGGIIGSFLFHRAAKPMVADAQLATSAYGHFIPLIYGSWRLPATVIWETDITTKKKGGGLLSKGMSSGTSYQYLQSAAFAFCQGPAQCLKIWLDGKLFVDQTSKNPVELTKHGFMARAYFGDEAQLPDPLIAVWVFEHASPPQACPAYRGLAYFVFENVDIQYYGNRMPNVTALWSTNVFEKIFITKFVHWPSTASYPLSDVAVDWGSARLYTFSGSKGNIYVFDIATGQQIGQHNFLDMYSPHTQPPGMNWGGGYFNGACVMQNSGYIYLSSGAFFYPPSPPVIYIVDPNSWKIVSECPLPYNPYNAYNWIEKIIPFQLVSAGSEPFDMLVCLWAAYPNPLIVTPWLLDVSPFIPLMWPGFGAWCEAVIGKQDTTSGVVEIWFLNTSEFDSAALLYIYKTVIDGSDPGDAAINTQLWRTFAYTDFPHMPEPVVGTDMMAQAAYDPADDSLILTIPLGGSIKWIPAGDPGPGDIAWTNDQLLADADITTAYYNLDRGIIGYGNTGGTGAFSVTQTNSGSTQGPYLPDTPELVGRTYAYNSVLNAIVYLGGGILSGTLEIAYLQRLAPDEYPVADILRDLCERAGIEAGAIDVSLVTDTTVGYAVLEEKSYGSAISDLCHTYQIDMVESDYKLKFIPKGQNPVAEIPEADLASSDANDPSKHWEAKRAIVQELPMQVNVRYSDPDLDFQPGAAYAKRIIAPVPTVFSQRVKTVDLPVAAHNQEARHIAETWLWTMWAERENYKTMTAQKYMWLDPTDNVVFDFASGDTIVARIAQTELGDDYSIKMDLGSEDIAVYVDAGSPGALISYVPQFVAQSSALDLLQFNTPLLRDEDDTGGTAMRIYYAGGPLAPVSSTTTATVYYSASGTDWAQYADMAAFADWGTTTTALGDTVAAFATDYVNTLTVALSGGSETPVSCTYYDLMNGANPALVGQEIIQFGQASQNADGTFTLSTLLRGRRGTEWATGGHFAGERIIFLEVVKIQGGRLPLSVRGVSTLWKLVPSGRLLDSTPTDSFAYRAYDLMPYAPVNAKRTYSGSDLLLTWIRRTRIGGLLVDGTDDASLSEASERYEVYFIADESHVPTFSPIDPSTYVRAYTGLTAPSLLYTAAQMVADGFSPGTDTLYAVIYQISAVVGRGFPGLHILPPVYGGMAVSLESASGDWLAEHGAWLWG